MELLSDLFDLLTTTNSELTGQEESDSFERPLGCEKAARV